MDFPTTSNLDSQKATKHDRDAVLSRDTGQQPAAAFPSVFSREITNSRETDPQPVSTAVSLDTAIQKAPGDQTDMGNGLFATPLGNHQAADENRSARSTQSIGGKIMPIVEPTVTIELSPPHSAPGNGAGHFLEDSKLIPGGVFGDADAAHPSNVLRSTVGQNTRRLGLAQPLATNIHPAGSRQLVSGALNADPNNPPDLLAAKGRVTFANSAESNLQKAPHGLHLAGIHASIMTSDGDTNALTGGAGGSFTSIDQPGMLNRAQHLGSSSLSANGAAADLEKPAAGMMNILPDSSKPAVVAPIEASLSVVARAGQREPAMQEDVIDQLLKTGSSFEPDALTQTVNPASLQLARRLPQQANTPAGSIDNGLGLGDIDNRFSKPGAINFSPASNLISNHHNFQPVEMRTTTLTTITEGQLSASSEDVVTETSAGGFGSSSQISQPSPSISRAGHSQFLGIAQYNDPQFQRNLGDQVLMMAGQGIQKAHLSLNPHELGPVEIRLSLVNDEVSIQLASANPMVRETIEEAMPRLRELFDEAGLKLGEHDVASEFSDGRFSDRERAEQDAAADDIVVTEFAGDIGSALSGAESSALIDTFA